MIVVFDAHCLLCSYWVNFLIRHDRSQTLRFASIQTTSGQRLLADAGLHVERLETLLVIDDDRSWQHTSAIIQVLSKLGWPWKAAKIAYLVPRCLRDAAYRLIARNRYQLFGRSDTCLIPSAETADRFFPD